MFRMYSRLAALAIIAAFVAAPVANSRAHEVWVTNMTSGNVTVFSAGS